MLYTLHVSEELLWDTEALQATNQDRQQNIQPSERLWGRATEVVAFTAVRSHDFGPVNNPALVQYEEVNTNVGDAFDNSTGLFTAPMDGVYWFSFFSRATDQAITTIGKNGITQVGAAHDFATGGSGYTVTLNSGDQVGIVLFPDYDGKLHSTYYGKEICFSGNLISTTTS